MRHQINESVEAVRTASSNQSLSRFQTAAPRIARHGLFVLLAYLLVTLGLYAYGPASFTRHAVAQTVALVLVYMALFAAGYLSVTQRPDAVRSTRGRPGTSLRLAKVIVLIGLLVALLKLTVYTSLETLSVGRLLDGLALSLQDPGAAYYNSFEDAQTSGPLIWALVLLSPVSWSAFAISVAFFRRLDTGFRLIVLVLFFAEAARWLLNGQNKGVFDLVIIIAIVLWIKTSQRQLVGAKSKRSGRRGRLPRTLFILACSLGAMALFTRAIMSRTDNLNAVSVVDPGPLMGLVPAWLQPTLIAITGYLGQGYHALSYIPQVQWDPAFGVGHSLFLSVRLDQYFGTNVVDRMYQSKLLVYGIDPSANWHSFYVWIANDVHWLGVIPIMYLLGRFTARVVLRALLNDSASNYALMSLVGIMLVYIPANAQIFQEPTTFMAFWGLVLYQLLHKPSRAQVLRSPMLAAATSQSRHRG